jgi:hypothetical protein
MVTVGALSISVLILKSENNLEVSDLIMTVMMRNDEDGDDQRKLKEVPNATSYILRT